MSFYLQGRLVCPSPYMPEFTTKHKKPIKFKRWMIGKCYGVRVQKKWDKKFGVTKERNFLMTKTQIVAHPNNVRALRLEIENANRGFNSSGICGIRNCI